MSPSPKHLLHFEGGNALSTFRAQALLTSLQAVSSRITGVAARHVHWVWAQAEVQPDATRKLANLLRYGDAYEGPASDAADTALVLVMPRLGTVSPWASKATDIAHNCGLALHRVERVTEYRLSLKTGLLGGVKTLTQAELQAAAMLLHDRMTESVAFERWTASRRGPLARPPPPPTCSTSARPSRWCTSTCWARAATRWCARTPSSVWPCPTMKSTTSSTRSAAWTATRPTSS